MTENQTELGELIAQTIGSVVQAQERLDQYALTRRKAYEEAMPGDLVLPPLWYQFNQVELELELSAQIEKIEIPGEAVQGPRLKCATLNPTSVSLYGYQASTGLRVRVQVAPQGNMWIKSPSEEGGTTDGGVHG